MTTFAGQTVLMSGGSRGIGAAGPLKLAADGANIALIAKTDQPHPKLPGTIHTAAAEIEAAGGSALPIVGDVRDEAAVAAAVEQRSAGSVGSTSSSTTPRRSTSHRWPTSCSTAAA